jgi:hypothetical protein
MPSVVESKCKTADNLQDAQRSRPCNLAKVGPRPAPSQNHDVGWEATSIRNKSAQLSARTRQSPLCFAMMRPNVFHGTNEFLDLHVGRNH